MSPAAMPAIRTSMPSPSRCLRQTPARVVRVTGLEAASHHYRKDEAAPQASSSLSQRPLASHAVPKVEDVFDGIDWKGKMPLNAAAGMQKKAQLALICDEDMLLHKSLNIKHKERPERLTCIISTLKTEKLLERCDLFKPDEVGRKYLMDIHPPAHVEDIESI